MKTSLSRLPEYAQKDLQQILSLVLEKLPCSEMVILYGSYAGEMDVKNNKETGPADPASSTRDYDLLVLTSKKDVQLAGHILDKISMNYFICSNEQVVIHFINDDIRKFDYELSKGDYFYAEILTTGIKLYDSEKYKLEKVGKPDFKEIYQRAKKFFDRNVEMATICWENVEDRYNEKDYLMCSYFLSLATELLFQALSLVHTLKKNHEYSWVPLLSPTCKYSCMLRKIFPRDTPQEKRLFDLLGRAFYEARYDVNFQVTPEDIDALLPKVEKLREVTEKICRAQIETYQKASADDGE